MRYRVTFSNGAQHEVDSDLPLIEFARGFSLETDIQAVGGATVEVPAAEEAPKPKSVTKRIKSALGAD